LSAPSANSAYFSSHPPLLAKPVLAFGVSIVPN
jgi:hypothetical protein